MTLSNIEFLQIVLNTTINSGGIEERKMIGRIDYKYRVDIRPIDHPPPHFHIISPDYNASFTILDCKRIEGDSDARVERKVIEFYQKTKDVLIEEWNNTRTKETEKFKI